MSSLCSSAHNNFSAVCSPHSLSETMNSSSGFLLRLECHLHYNTPPWSVLHKITCITYYIMSFWNSQALIFIFYGYSTRNLIQNPPWEYVDIHFFTYPHLTIFQKIINISILYRKKLVLFYNCLIIVGNNIHMIHK